MKKSAFAALALAFLGFAGAVLFAIKSGSPESRTEADLPRPCDLASPSPVPADIPGQAAEGKRTVASIQMEAPNRLEAPVPAEAAVTAVSRVEVTLPVEEDIEAVRTIRVPVGEVLARVNNAAITLADLVGGSPAAPEETMSVEQHDFLLNNAIERELVLQAARQQGVQLTEEQVREQEEARKAFLARDGEEAGNLVHLGMRGTLEEQADFEMREAASQLLLASLLARAGAPSPHVTPEQVKQYYQDHLAEYSQRIVSRPVEEDTGWKEVDLEIREKLAPVVQREYELELREFIDQLKAEADISVVAARR